MDIARDEAAPRGGGARDCTRRHTVLLSDVHLSQAHPDDPTDPLWMRYRLRRFHPDDEFAELVAHLLETRGDDAIEVVFNGDLFDFDAPWVKDGTSSFDEFALDERGCTEQIQRILADHPVWFGATAKLVRAGHRVLFTSGNHDVELYFEGVRRAIVDEIHRHCVVEAPGFDCALVEERVRFRTWFHVTEDRLYIEHGSQYDVFNGVRHAMLPVTREGDRIHPMFGKLAFKRTGSRMGYFNPYYEETFYMGLFGYLGHFWKFYLRSDKHIIRTWCMGSLRTVLEIWRHRHRDERLDEGRRRARVETGASHEAIDETHALRAKPAEDTMLPILRELWLDRVLLFALLFVVVAAVFAVGGVARGLVALASSIVLFALYELVTPKPDIRTYDSAPPSVLRLFDIHGVRALCMGHTHRPFARWDDEGRVYANSGSWAPAFHDQMCTQPVLEKRPVLLLSSEGDALWGGLAWWRDGQLEPASGEWREEPTPREGRSGREPAIQGAVANG